MSMSQNPFEPPPFMKPGHPAGDLLTTSEWKFLCEERGLIEVEAPLPAHLLNPKNQLFGGFTGTYVDMIAILTTRSLFDESRPFHFSPTINMRIDFLAPVVGPRFLLRGELINQGRSTTLVATHFSTMDGEKLVYAITTLRVHAG